MKLDSKLIKYYKYFYEISEDKDLPNNFCGFWFLMVIALVFYPIIIILTFPYTALLFFKDEIGYKHRYEKNRTVAEDFFISLAILTVLFIFGCVLAWVLMIYTFFLTEIGILLEGIIFLVLFLTIFIVSKLFGTKIKIFMDKNCKKMDYE